MRAQPRSGGFNPYRRDQLLHGHVFLRPPSPRDLFADEAEMRAAWQQHRDQLMHILGPGRRPWAYWKFDIGLADPPTRGSGIGRWWYELAEIDRRNLLQAGESEALEQLYPELRESAAPSAAVEAYLAMLMAGPSAAADPCRRYTEARAHAELLAIAAEWHRRRGRGETGARFEAAAEACMAALESDSAARAAFESMSGTVMLARLERGK